MKNTEYDQALSFLSSYNGRTTRRDNGYHHKIMMELLQLILINPKEFTFIQITGSCGKGSTAQFLSSILTHHAMDHGLFTGPHLTAYEERFAINGSLIDREEFSSIVLHIEQMLRHYPLKEDVGHMDVMIMIALTFFQRHGIKLVVFENGVGGKTDPSNIFDPLIAVFTEITMDHSHLLGSTIEDIILDKSCIIKHTTKYAICGMNNVQARNFLLKIEHHCDTVFRFLHRDYDFITKSSDTNGNTFYFKGIHYAFKNIQTRLLGTHQVQNASNAIAVIEAMVECGYTFKKDVVIQALYQAAMPCRMEMIEKNGVTFLFDGAHNTLELKTLKESMDTLGLQVSSVMLSISSNKDVETMMRSIHFDHASYIITPHPFTERNISAEQMEKSLSAIREIKCFYFQNIKSALNHIFHLYQKNQVVLVTGSLYLVGHVKKYVLNEGKK
ncbi:MAG: bifunctional folylpolyglutamate synthase/dihydrofolate synthase [Heyndrickxia sp.]